MRQARKTNVKLQRRDLQVLAFLWRWKLVSNSALTSRRLFPKANEVTAYNRLVELRRSGYIQLRGHETGERFAWTLTQKGFKAIRDHLPKLKEDGFGSEHFYHDILVTSLHLGNWLVDRPEGVSFVSEQELRRYFREKLSAWVPDSNVHRPDGYWGFQSANGIVAVAIEVEVNQKHLSAYEGVGEYYADHGNVHRVLWMIQSVSTAKSIQRKISEGTSKKDKIHNFILEAEFLEKGWQSGIVLGPEAKQSLDSFLNGMVGRKASEAGAKTTDRLFLEPRKCYVRPASWRKVSLPHDRQLPTTLYV